MRFKEGTKECVVSSTVMTNVARGLLASKQKVKNSIITRLLGGPLLWLHADRNPHLPLFINHPSKKHCQTTHDWRGLSPYCANHH